MKKKTLLFVLLGIFATCFLGYCTFLGLQGTFAVEKANEYFDAYKSKAEDYIKSDPQIVSTFGEDISVEFADSWPAYSESGEKGPFDRYIKVFVPNIPKDLDEFTARMEMIQFDVKINGQPYQITFEKNSEGDLAVSSLTEGET